MAAKQDLLDDLQLAYDWFRADIENESDSSRSRQLRYSLCNKLAADWQKFVREEARASGVATNNLGNCWPSQIDRAYRAARIASPLDGMSDTLLEIFDRLNPVRNAIDHGGEPPSPSNEDLLTWIDGLRQIAGAYP